MATFLRCSWVFTRCSFVASAGRSGQAAGWSGASLASLLFCCCVKGLYLCMLAAAAGRSGQITARCGAFLCSVACRSSSFAQSLPSSLSHLQGEWGTSTEQLLPALQSALAGAGAAAAAAAEQPGECGGCWCFQVLRRETQRLTTLGPFCACPLSFPTQQSSSSPCDLTILQCLPITSCRRIRGRASSRDRRLPRARRAGPVALHSARLGRQPGAAPGAAGFW